MLLILFFLYTTFHFALVGVPDTMAAGWARVGAGYLPYVASSVLPLAAATAVAEATRQLAPNPAHGQVHLVGLPSGTVAVRLLDVQGRLVRTATSAAVSLAGLAPGL